jgi:hypothetical protein
MLNAGYGYARSTEVKENKFRLPEPQAEPDHFRPRNAIRTKGKVYSLEFELPTCCRIVAGTVAELTTVPLTELRETPVRTMAGATTSRGPPVSC